MFPGSIWPQLKKMHLFLFRHGTVNHFGTRESWKLYQGMRTTHTPKEEKWYDFSADCTDMVFLGPASKHTVSQLWHQFLTLQPSDNRKAAKGSIKSDIGVWPHPSPGQEVKGCLYGGHISSIVLTTDCIKCMAFHTMEKACFLLLGSSGNFLSGPQWRIQGFPQLNTAFSSNFVSGFPFKVGWPVSGILWQLVQEDKCANVNTARLRCCQLVVCIVRTELKQAWMTERVETAPEVTRKETLGYLSSRTNLAERTSLCFHLISHAGVWGVPDVTLWWTEYLLGTGMQCQVLRGREYCRMGSDPGSQ